MPPERVRALAARLPGMSLTTTADHGVDADAKEALLTATLAWAHVHRLPANLPAVTGASARAVLGVEVPAP